MPQIEPNKLRKLIQTILRGEMSDRAAGAELGVGKSTVNKYRQLTAELKLDAAKLKELSDDELAALCSAHPEQPKEEKIVPDWPAIVKYKKGHSKATLQMLYNELYLKRHLSEDVYASHEIPDCVYSYKTFVKLYGQWCEAHIGTGDFPGYYFNPGQLVEIDYAGDPIYWRDLAGNTNKARLFVGVFRCSGWIFALATPSMTTRDWLNGIIAMFQAAGGVTMELTCDNDAALVLHPDRRVGELNAAVSCLLDYYRVSYFTAAVAKPKEKPLAENSVGILSRNVIQALQVNGMPKVHDLDELNVLVREKTAFINTAPYSDKSRGSRQLAFEQSEKPALNPLPQEPFTQLKWGRTRTDAKASAVVNNARYRLPYTYKSSSLYYSIDLLNTVRFFDPNTSREICSYDGAGKLLSAVEMDHPHVLDMARPNKEFIDRCDAEQRYTPSIRACLHAFVDAAIRTKAFGSFNQRVKQLCLLIERYGEVLVDKACREAIDRGTPADYQFIKKYLELFRDTALPKDKSEADSKWTHAAESGAVLAAGDIFGSSSEPGKEDNHD